VPSLQLSVGLISLSIWLYLVFARGTFWRLRPFDDDAARNVRPTRYPTVVAIIPARNEAETIGQTVAALLQQDYPGKFSVLVMDDHSEDATSQIAQRTVQDNNAQSRVEIHLASALPAGWTGKLWALNEGVTKAAAHAPTFYWFTDADIVHAPDTLRRLVARAEQNKLDLASLMVLLQAKTLPERALIPAFLFFFLKLYPPRWTADPRARTAGAAGGCILLRRESLERLGGFPAMRNEVIDDCALARAVKRSGTSKRVSCHTLRHSYATNLMEQGLDVRVIQGLLGHRSLKTTTLYLHMTQSILQSVQAAVNDLTADL